MVELEQRDDFVALTACGELQLGPYVEKELGKPVLTVKDKIQALIDVLRESKAKANSSVVAIPLSEGFVSTVSITAGAAENLDARVKVEARKYVPVPLKEISLEWVELPPVKQTVDEATHEVLIVAVHNDSYQDMTALIDSTTTVTRN